MGPEQGSDFRLRVGSHRTSLTRGLLAESPREPPAAPHLNSVSSAPAGSISLESGARVRQHCFLRCFARRSRSG